MKKLILVLLLTLLTSLVGTVQANVETAMRDHLNAMVAGTPPTVMSSANSNGVYFGSFNGRYNMVTTPPLFSFEPPSLRSGCGGFDLFAGSFSFISAEQIMALLRSIASAVPAIAFEMALSVLSEQLADKIRAWMDTLQSVNMGQLNTCRITTSLLSVAKGKNNMGDVFRMIGNDLGLNQLVESGTSADASEAGDTSGGQSPGATAAAAADAQAREAMVVGNLTWRILKTGNGEQWLSGGSTEMLEQWQSMIGTVIGCYKREGTGCSINPDDVPDDGSGSAPEPISVGVTEGKTLDLRTLVLAEPDGSLKVTLLRCLDGFEAMECLRVEPRTLDSYKGMKRVLEDELLGTTNAMGSGHLGRHRLKMALTDRDKRVRALGGALVRQALLYTDRDEALGRRFVKTFSQQIATEITYNMTRDLMKEVRTALAETKGLTGREQALELIDNAEAGIEMDAQALMATSQAQIAMANILSKQYEDLAVRK